ncbi:MAG: ribosome biogenesis GTPase Der [Mollicutes bacterium]|nr:ribosome biogenesis GTPase Der [Mollicutes bacterium]
MKTVCLIGKPNVGKSTIFNRLIKERKAIILDTPGVTRDRIYGIVTYNDISFHLIDTGGITSDNNEFDNEVLIQANIAIDEADIILFVVDGTAEIDIEDKNVREMLHKANKKVIVVVNKLDNKERANNIYNYYELGFENVIGVSAEHNIGFDKLLNEIIKDMRETPVIEDPIIKFCVVGRPNVGKSSLINTLINDNRLIVSDKAGTTRDAVDTKFKYNNEEYVVIDTAGIRKKGKIYENIEKYSLLRSLKAIDRSDVVVLVINAEEGIIEHDKHIASFALEAGKALVIAVNKWDTVKKPNEMIKEWNLLIKEEFKFISYVNTVYVSAKNRKRIGELMPNIIKAVTNHRKQIATSVLNDIITQAVVMHNPPSYKGKRLKIYFVHQTGYRPPKITFEVNNKRLVHFSYKRYLENEIRKAVDLEGTPIILQFKNKND